MSRNFEFRDNKRYSFDGRDLSKPTIPEISLCTKVIRLSLR